MDNTTLLAVTEFSRMRLLAILDTIEKTATNPAPVLSWRPGPGRAHIAWQAMHCVATHDKYLNVNIRGAQPRDPNVVTAYGGGSTPSDQNIPTLAIIRSTLTTAYEDYRQFVSTVNADEMQRKGPSGRTVAESIILLAWHEAHHQGQIHLTLEFVQAGARNDVRSSMRTRILSELCSVPTAPFAEQHVVEYVKSFVKARPRLRLSKDRFGNLLIELPSKSRSPRWVFTAHMDHPGFVAEKMIDARTLRAAFRGYVLGDYVQDAKVRFFDANREIAGKIIKVSMRKSERPDVPASVLVRVNDEVSRGSPGMFDLGVGQIRGMKFYSRVCDDLAGAAACLTMLDELAKKPPKSTIAVLLTRAEEEGFIGAIAAVTKPGLIRKSDRLIAIECSAAQSYAAQGAGTIIRVGDRTSVFNSDLTYFITTHAADLAKKEKDFKYQRALMPGGTCEATVYDIYGFLAASICVPLGNYHNMNVAAKKLGPEFVDINDWKNMARLFVHLARTAHQYQPGHRVLKERVEKRFRKLAHLLETGDV